MTRGPLRWPSRKLQVSLVLLLVVGALWTVFVPPLSHRARAEQYYLDAWLTGFEKRTKSGGPDTECLHKADMGMAARKARAAFKLRPGDPLYQQALVWFYPKEKLPLLLKQNKMGPEARRLAAGLMCKYRMMEPPVPNLQWQLSTMAPVPKIDTYRLRELEKLQAADSRNSLVRYLKACVLQNAGDLDGALAEIRAGNRLPGIRCYVPEVSRQIHGTVMWECCSGQSFDLTPLGWMASRMGAAASERLRSHDAAGAVAVLEEVRAMGLKMMEAEPNDTIGFTVGTSVFTNASLRLAPIYKDFGMTDRLNRYRGLERAVMSGSVVQKNLFHAINFGFSVYGWEGHAWLLFAFIGAAGLLALFLIAATFVAWLVAAGAKKPEDADVSVAPWSEGFLARVLLVLYVPVWAIFVYLVYTLPAIPTPATEHLPTHYLEYLPVLVLLIVVLRVLHRRSDETEGRRTGILSFLFRSTAPTKKWTRKYIMAALAAQVAFLCCSALLYVILYKPIMGYQVWQWVPRTRLQSYLKLDAGIHRLASDLHKLEVSTYK